jgi:hypothetical protein
VAKAHDTWLHWAGGRNDLPGQYQTLARKLMGEVSERARGAGHAVAAREIKLPDGAIIRAELWGAIPRVSVKLPPKVQTISVQLESLLGIVTKPRKFGVNFDPFPVDTTNGENFYGELAHVLLRDRAPRAVSPEWQPQYYDDSNVVDARYYGGFIPDGFYSHGNVDWRDAQQRLSVTWIGAPSRSAGYGWSLFYVFHNGQLLFDLTDFDDPDGKLRVVNCACLKVIGTDLYLYVLAVPAPFPSDFEDVALKVYRAKLRPHPDADWPFDTALYCPVLDRVLAADVETVLTVDTTGRYPNMEDFTQGAWNQAATQARAIVLHTLGDDTIRADEVFIDLAAEGGPAATWTEHALTVVRTQAYDEQTVQANGAYFKSWEWIIDSDPPPPAEGNHPFALNINVTITDGNQSSGQTSYQPVVGVAGSGSLTTTVTGDAIPISVDFRDNVPVRLFWRPATGSLSGTYTAPFTTNFDVSGSSNATYNSSLQRVYFYEQTLVERGMSWGLNHSFAGSLSGGTVFVQVEGEASPWVTLTMGASCTGSSAESREWSYEWERVLERTGTGAIELADGLVTVEGTIAGELAETWSSTVEEFAVWWLDMRYDAITYSEATETTAGARSYTLGGTRSESTNTDNTNGSLSPGLEYLPYIDPIEISASSTSRDNDYTITVTVMFDRAVQDTNTLSWSNTESGSYTPSNFYTGTLRYDWQRGNGFFAALATIGNRVGVPWVVGLRAHPPRAEAELMREALVGLDPALTDLSLTDTYQPVDVVVDDYSISYPTFMGVALHDNLYQGMWEPTMTESGARSWLERKPDTDVRTAVNLEVPKGWGTWIVYRGRWAYSIPWPAGDLTTATWRTDIEGAADLPDIIGFAADAELFTPMHPLSLCITRVPDGMTVDNLKDL